MENNLWNLVWFIQENPLDIHTIFYDVSAIHFFQENDRPTLTVPVTDPLEFSIAYRSRLILGLLPANERRCYKVTKYFIGWAQTWISPVVRFFEASLVWD